MIFSECKSMGLYILLVICLILGCIQPVKAADMPPAVREGPEQEGQVTQGETAEPVSPQAKTKKPPKWEWQVSEEKTEEEVLREKELKAVPKEFTFPKKTEKAEVAPPVPSEEEKVEVSINFQSADIKEVLQLLFGDLLNVNYTVDKKVTGAITLRAAGKFRQSELLQIIQTALNVNGFAHVKKGQVLEVLPIQEARQEQGVVDVGKRVLTSTEDIVTQIVPCEHIAPQDIIPTLRTFMTVAGFVIAPNDTHALVISDKASNMERLLTVLGTFDVPFFAGKALKFYNIRHANAQNLAKDLDALAQSLGAVTKGRKGQLSFIPFQDTNKLLVATNTPELFSTVDLWIENIDVAIAEKAMQLYVYKLQHQKAETVAAALNEIYSEQVGAELRKGPTPAAVPTQVEVTGGGVLLQGRTAATRGPMKIIAEPATNSIIIKAPPADYQDIRRVIEILDTTPQQVLIEVLIAEVTLTDALAYGVEHFFRQNFGSGLISLEPSSVISAAAVPNPLSGGTRVFRLRKDITTIFNLLDTTTQVEVLSTPHILVQDEEAATIQVGASEPILAQQISVPIAGTTPTTTGGTFATQNQVQYRDIGVILTVKPRIGENRMVTIQVTQEVTNLAQEVTRGINSPRFTTRKAETFLTVEDEHTIVIGGIIETRLENTIRRVPVLNRVPLLGKLFKSEDKTKRKTELLVLLTPRIVSTSDEIDLATKNFEEKLKLIESLRKEQK